MLKELQINTANNHIIYGTIDENDSKTLLIFVHGFHGNQDEHHYFNAVPFFRERGFDTFRFDLYSRKPKARSLSNSSLTGHSADLELIIENFKNKYENIVLIGHSLGAFVILKTNLADISKIILWDPTTTLKNAEEKNATYNTSIDKYIFHWEFDLLVGKEMIKERKAVDLNKLTNELDTPCKFIFAGNYNKHELRKPYLKNIKTKSESTIIKGASHGFVEEGTEKRLFEETFERIKE